MAGLPPLSPEQAREDRGPQLLAVVVTFTLLSQIAVGLRIWSRRLMHQHLWWDDWLVAAAAVITWYELIALQQSIEVGMGKHQQLASADDIETFLIWTFGSEIWYAIHISLVKSSIICLYVRLFRVKTAFLKFCYAMLGFVIAWGIASFFTTVFQCHPIKAAWVKTPEMLKTAKCLDLRDWQIGNNVPNILADIIIILMPMRLVWNLKLSTMRRLGLCVTFLIAFTTTAVSITRFVLNITIDVLDATYGFVNVGIFSTIEANVGIVCACLPVLAPLARKAVGKEPNKSTSTSTRSGEGHNAGDIPLGAISSRNADFRRLDDDSDEHLWVENEQPLHATTTRETPD